MFWPSEVSCVCVMLRPNCFSEVRFCFLHSLFSSAGAGAARPPPSPQGPGLRAWAGLQWAHGLQPPQAFLFLLPAVSARQHDLAAGSAEVKDSLQQWARGSAVAPGIPWKVALACREVRSGHFRGSWDLREGRGGGGRKGGC